MLITEFQLLFFFSSFFMCNKVLNCCPTFKACSSNFFRFFLCNRVAAFFVAFKACFDSTKILNFFSLIYLLTFSLSFFRFFLGSREMPVLPDLGNFFLLF